MTTKAQAGIAVTVAILALAGCDRMATQPKVEAYRPNPDLAAGHRLPPPGAVAREEHPVPPPPVTMALLQRGRQRYDIYCAPCHSYVGDGDGMIVRRGFPHPPSYMIDRLLNAPPQHFYDVITNGYGVMYSYAARVDPEDRWAIAAYIRALQASQHAPAANLTPDEKAKLP